LVQVDTFPAERYSQVDGWAGAGGLGGGFSLGAGVAGVTTEGWQSVGGAVWWLREGMQGGLGAQLRQDVRAIVEGSLQQVREMSRLIGGGSQCGAVLARAVTAEP
jgi:hypothetical protein